MRQVCTNKLLGIAFAPNNWRSKMNFYAANFLRSVPLLLNSPTTSSRLLLRLRRCRRAKREKLLPEVVGNRIQARPDQHRAIFHPFAVRREMRQQPFGQVESPVV